MKWDIQTLFRRHAKELKRSLQRRGFTEDVAADLTQDAFLRMLSTTPTGAEDNPRAYLFQVSRNLVIDHERKRKVAPIDAISEELLDIAADTRPPADIALGDKQRLLACDAALAELPERTRRAFILYRLEDMTIAEVAKVIGLSTTQTWSLIRDAYRHIRSRLNGI